MVQIWMLSDKWLSRYELLKNLHIKLYYSVLWTWMPKVTTIAILVLRTGELKLACIYFNMLVNFPHLKWSKAMKSRQICKKKNLSWLFGVDWKNLPSGSLCITASPVMPNTDPWDRFFYPQQAAMKDSYILVNCYHRNFLQYSQKSNTKQSSHKYLPNGMLYYPI